MSFVAFAVLMNLSQLFITSSNGYAHEPDDLCSTALGSGSERAPSKREQQQAQRERNRAQKEREKQLISVFRDAARELKERFSVSESTQESMRELGLAWDSSEGLIRLVLDAAPKLEVQIKDQMVKVFTKFARVRKRLPTEAEMMREMGLSPEAFSVLVGPQGLFYENLFRVYAAAVRRSPRMLADVVDTYTFGADRRAKLVEALRVKTRYVIVGVEAGAPVDREFLGALKTYCRERDAALLVVPFEQKTLGLDPLVVEDPEIHVVLNRVELGPFLVLDPFRFPIRNVNPFTQAQRVLSLERKSLIVPVPRLDFKTYPTIENRTNGRHLQIFGIGSLSVADYAAGRYTTRVTEEAASLVHTLGALVVEKSSLSAPLGATGEFFMRQIEFLPGGQGTSQGFVDLGRRYTASGSAQVSPLALVLGDIHVGSTDEKLIHSIRDVVAHFQPREIFLHDLFDGHSVSHHERGRLLVRARRADSGRDSLTDELRNVVVFINALMDLDTSASVKIVSSNHNDWLKRYLDGVPLGEDPQNDSARVMIMNALLNDPDWKGRSPLEYALLNEEFGRRFKIPRIEGRRLQRLVFLSGDTSQRVGPDQDPLHQVECAQHGHAGANGARGSMRSFQMANHRAIFGHTHTCERAGGIVNVGTSTQLSLAYSAEGFSSWVQSMAVVNPDGSIQVLQAGADQGLHGSHPIFDRDEHRCFFPTGFPRLIENAEPTE